MAEPIKVSPCKGDTSYDCQLQTCHGLPLCGTCCKCQNICMIEMQNSGKAEVELVQLGGIHEWPEPGEHLWSPWKVFSRTEHTRTCLHPDCHAVQKKKAANA